MGKKTVEDRNTKQNIQEIFPECFSLITKYIETSPINYFRCFDPRSVHKDLGENAHALRPGVPPDQLVHAAFYREQWYGFRDGIWRRLR